MRQRSHSCETTGGVVMSALGHKRTYAVQTDMSALPPIATEKANFRKRSCLLYPRKRTCAVQLGMSALGQKRTFCVRSEPGGDEAVFNSAPGSFWTKVKVGRLQAAASLIFLK